MAVDLIMLDIITTILQFVRRDNVFYYVNIEDNKIISAWSTNNKLDKTEVTEEIFNQITRLPANFETNEEGNIISVTNTPEPLPTIEEIDNQVVEMIRQQYDQNAEYKMLRLGILDATNEEFIAYNTYIEECRLWGKNKKIELGLITVE